jgi:hypothetical protein
METTLGVCQAVETRTAPVGKPIVCVINVLTTATTRGVAAAVATANRGANPADLIDLEQHPDATELRDCQIALGIDIGRNVVRDLTCVATNANTPVKCGGAQPQRPLLHPFVEYHPSRT